MSLSARCLELQPLLTASPANSLTDYKSLQSNHLKDLLLKGSYSSPGYQNSVSATKAGLIIVGIVVILIYVLAVINAIWIRNYPNKAKGIWSICRKPLTQRNRRGFFRIGFLCCLIMLGSAVAGAIISGSNEEDAEKAACGLLLAFNQTIDGNPSNSWGGLSLSLNSYEVLRDRFASEIGSVNMTFLTDSTGLQSTLQEYQSNLDSLYETRTNYFVKSANYMDASNVLIEPALLKISRPQGSR